MKGLSIQNLMRKLSIIPGLTFLDRWVTEMNTLNTRMAQRVDDLQGYVDVAREGAGEVVGAVGDGDVQDGDSEDFVPRPGSGGEYDYGAATGYGDDERHLRETSDGCAENYEDVFYDDRED